MLHVHIYHLLRDSALMALMALMALPPVTQIFQFRLVLLSGSDPLTINSLITIFFFFANHPSTPSRRNTSLFYPFKFHHP